MKLQEGNGYGNIMIAGMGAGVITRQVDKDRNSFFPHADLFVQKWLVLSHVLWSLSRCNCRIKQWDIQGLLIV